MGLAEITERMGDTTTLALGGAVVGLLFGCLAQRSRFCLRAATIEFSEGKLGSKIAVWALAFSAAVTATQGAIALQWLDASGARQLADRGSISGALIGGAMFGAGMILARGCASRLLVLSATGNLRALVSGLILTVIAQASLRGVLAPVREALAGAWTVDGGTSREIFSLVGGGARLGVALGVTWLLIGVWLAKRNKIGWSKSAEAAGVGLCVAAGWIFTYAMSQASFEPVRITSVTFTGPSADTLMGLINSRSVPLSFDTGLVPGVFLGAFFAALLKGEFKVQGFEQSTGMGRYLLGAPLMGFGGMLAGGCAVGAGMSGGAIFALTSWLALSGMWISAVITQRAVASAIDNVPKADERGQHVTPATR